MTHRGSKRSLFREKVIVCRESVEDVTTDCFVNFCCPNILSGTGYFERIHNLAGTELATACEKFVDICPTSSCVTPSYQAKNFKFIVHTVVPNPLDLGRLVDVKKVYICIRNSLELAVEEGAKTIAFPCHFPGLSTRIACELVLRIFTVWIHRNKYSEQLSEIKILCRLESVFHQFVQAARTLYEEANAIGHKFVPAFMKQRMAYNRRLSRPRQYRRIYDPAPQNAPQVQLELSAKLAPTILVIDDENGMKRQYRLTNKSRDGRKLYFRCSRCDTLIKKDGLQVRAKLIVEDGQIVSDRFPQHHPACEAKPLEQVLIQQVDRTSRREVKDGYLLPQDAYRKALDRMRFEAQQLGIPVEECFPEWSKLRQQYCRIRKQAVRQRQQAKWEMLMMGQPWNDEYAGEFVADQMGEEYLYEQQYGFRRQHPFVPRARYSPSYGGVVISYDDEEELQGMEIGAEETELYQQQQQQQMDQQQEQPRATAVHIRKRNTAMHESDKGGQTTQQTADHPADETTMINVDGTEDA